MTSRRISDADVEAMLAGRRPADPELGVLSDAVDGIRRTYVTEMDDAHVVGLSGRLAAVAAAAPLDGGPVGASRPSSSGTRRRGAIALALAGLGAVAFGGAAMADEAAPGDFLYGLDRALEVVGINNGGAQERLAEVQALLADDEVEQALDTSVEAVEDMDGMDDDEAEELAGILHAAESVLNEGSEQSLERREQVAAMLTFMTQTELTGREFGQAVSQHARGIVEPEAADEDAVAAEGGSGSEPAVEEDVTDEAPGNSGNANGGAGNSKEGSGSSGSNAGGAKSGDDAGSSTDEDAKPGPNSNSNPNATADTRGNSGDKSKSTSKD